MSKRGKPYDLGPLPRANISILAIIENGGTHATTVYRIEYLCCGATGVLPHKAIHGRIYDERKYCAACALDAARKTRTDITKTGRPRKLPDYGVTPPTWPAPGVGK